LVFTAAPLSPLQPGTTGSHGVVGRPELQAQSDVDTHFHLSMLLRSPAVKAQGTSRARSPSHARSAAVAHPAVAPCLIRCRAYHLAAARRLTAPFASHARHAARCHQASAFLLSPNNKLRSPARTSATDRAAVGGMGRLRHGAPRATGACRDGNPRRMAPCATPSKDDAGGARLWYGERGYQQGSHVEVPCM
jgi:hypothetical protein